MGPICLPFEKINITGRFGYVAGWGLTEKGKPSPELLKVNLPILNLQKCKEAYPVMAITENNLCVDGLNKSNSCFGDSGGPFKISGKIYNDTRYIQHGIVSFGQGQNCTLRAMPVVYTNVSKYLNFILDNVNP